MGGGIRRESPVACGGQVEKGLNELDQAVIVTEGFTPFSDCH